MNKQGESRKLNQILTFKDQKMEQKDIVSESLSNSNRYRFITV